jgi:glyoxylase-like metal-dependent hydrolase (beta-lactamase superfamily II)
VTKQIAPGVHEMNVGGTSAFLLDFEGEVTLIDTGRPGNVDKIWSGLAEIGRSPEDVRNVLLTHYHIDHIGCLGPLWERTGASVYAPAGDAALIRSGGMIPQMESRGLLGAALLRFIKPAPIPAHEVDLEAADGHLLFVAEGVQVVATPGHTGGHAVYLWPQHGGVLFAGDVCFNLLGRLAPPPIGEDLTRADKSFVKVSQLDFEAACIGHGSSISKDAGARFRKVAAGLTS